jgi:hypothetical protein
MVNQAPKPTRSRARVLSLGLYGSGAVGALGVILVVLGTSTPNLATVGAALTALGALGSVVVGIAAIRRPVPRISRAGNRTTATAEIGSEFLDAQRPRIVLAAASEFVANLHAEARERLGENVDVGWLTESDWVQNRVASFGLLMAETAPAGGGEWCDDGTDQVPLDAFSRPTGPRYRRCRGHSPPHCYDNSGAVIECP